MVNTARVVANLVKSLNWAWPDVVIGHSIGVKVALQYTLRCAQGDYGDSVQLPKQLWILDAGPGKVENNTKVEELEKALHSLVNLPSQIPSHEWLVNHMVDLEFSKFISEWLGSNLKKSGEHETLTFRVDDALQMLKSLRETDNWAFLEHSPKGIEVTFTRIEKWDSDVVERLEKLAAQESDESTGKVSIRVVPHSGHWIYKDQPDRLLEIMTPKIASLVQAKS